MTAERNVQPREFVFTGWHMWGLAIAFFGVIISVNVLLAVVSATSWTGMVVPDSYVAGQTYEAERVAHDAQQAAGWRADLTYEAGIARLHIVDGDNHPVDLGSVTLQVNRPVGGHEDQVLQLTQKAVGDYEATFHLAPGLWEAQVTAPETTKGPFTSVTRFVVEGPGS
jgi:nitrogen fixation protein FixH